MKTLIKESFRTIKNSYKRFISILVIVLLGVGFFAGIKATSPDMKDTINAYYKKSQMYDLELLSTWGINENELNILKKDYKVEGSKQIDAFVKNSQDDNEDVAKIISYNKENKFNKIVLLEGTFPTKNDECLIDSGGFFGIYKIGDTLKITDDNLKNKEYKIVGVVKSPLYISLERGTTKLGTGKINYFIYIPEEEFNFDYYTNIYIRVSDEDTFSDDYEKIIKQENKKLTKITNELKKTRLEEEKEKALKEYQKNLNKLKQEKEKTANKLNKEEQNITNKENEYNNNYQKFQTTKTNYATTYQEKLNTINNSLEELEILITSCTEMISNTSDIETLETLNNNLIELNTQKEILNNNLIELKNADKEYQEEFKQNEQQLTNAKQQINNGKKLIQESRTKANKEFAKNEKKLANSLEKINNLKAPTWYILDRESNIGYYQFKEDTQRIANLGMVFPLVFFAVAILVCLTSMTRMVEEERMTLGTYKSLGYNSSKILFKYILYALTATIIGSVIGLLIGFNLLPKVIFNMYSMMYNIGNIKISFNLQYALLGIISAIICTLGATIITAIKSLKEQPSELLRPKKMNSGKRIFLEKINLIWNKLKFTSKVTYRNVFRYKKRMFMTIIGVAGCTGLIIAGYGLKDCVTGMVSSQYGDVFKYDLEIALSEDKNNDKIIKELIKIPQIKKVLRLHKENVTLKDYKTNQTIYLMVPFDEIDDFISLKNRNTNQKYNLDDGIVISEKITNLLNIKKNTKLTISGNKDYQIKVTDISENYLYHYIYMNQKKYNSENYNTLLIKTSKLSSDEEKQLAKEINKIQGISSLSFTSSMSHVFDKTMDNFEYVVLVLIVSANLLAFVVLYNLASVNMSERQRELATIKVLGFYDNEVFNYIGRETIILTIISLIFGLGVGRVLTTFIIKTCELDMIMFNPKIKITSYLYGIILTIIFTLVVNITTYFSLKKIKMVESLKSVE